MQSFFPRQFVACLVLFPACANAFNFSFSCQVHPLWLRVMHSIDVSSGNSPFVEETLQGGAIDIADNWLRTGYFQELVAVGVSTFSNKKFITGDANDHCHKEVRPLRDEAVGPTISSIVAPVGEWSGVVSVNDALFNVASMDWTDPADLGRKVVFVYAGSEIGEYPTPGMPSFDVERNCELVSSPPSGAVHYLNEVGIKPIFVVPPHLVDYYSTLYETNLVIPQVADAEMMATYLLMGLDSYFCFAPVPTAPPAPTGSPTAITDTCSSGAVLQLVLAQDISYSYSNDLPIFQAMFPHLFSQFQDSEDFALINVGLVSFSDKPFAPFGYPGDYCYREDLQLTSTFEDFSTAVGNLEILSGRDWKESQYSVLRSSVLSENLGWTWEDEVGGRQVLRVVLLATDSLAHTNESAPGLPPVGSDCETTNYPHPEDVGEAFNSKNSYAIVLSTKDVYGKWQEKVEEFEMNTTPQVVRLDQATDDLYIAIKDALEDACTHERRRQFELGRQFERRPEQAVKTDGAAQNKDDVLVGRRLGDEANVSLVDVLNGGKAADTAKESVDDNGGAREDNVTGCVELAYFIEAVDGPPLVTGPPGDVVGSLVAAHRATAAASAKYIRISR